MSIISKVASALLVSAVFAGPASGVTIFSNAATFEAAAGATTLEDFDKAPTGAGSAGPYDLGAFSIFAKDVLFTPDSFVSAIEPVSFPGTRGFEFFGGKRQVATFTGGIYELTFDFDTPIAAFGIRIFDLGTQGPTTLSLVIDGNPVTIFNDIETGRTVDRMGEFLFTSSLFAGVVEKQGFRRLTFSATTPGDYVELDDLQFSLAAVPEPSTWMSLIIGFGLCGLRMRRHQSGKPRLA